MKDVKFLPDFAMSCADRGAGSADRIRIGGQADGLLRLSFSRQSRTGSNRGDREMFTFLDRSAAQALGHHLLAQSQNQPVTSQPLRSASATLSCYNNLADGSLVQGVVSAIRPEADARSNVVILRIELIHHGRRRAGQIEEAALVVERDQAYRFAQSLTALARE